MLNHSECPLCASPANQRTEINHQPTGFPRNSQYDYLRALLVDCEQCGQYAIQEVSLHFLTCGELANFHKQTWKSIVDENNSLPENQPVFLVTDSFSDVKAAKLGDSMSLFELFDVRKYLESTRKRTF